MDKHLLYRTLSPAKGKDLNIGTFVVELALTGLVCITHFSHTLWLFTTDDFDTFVIPNCLFGIFTALSREVVQYPEHGIIISHVLERLPLVIFFNWSNLLVFDLANQRLPDSIQEDRVNKPWRPLPTQRITPEQTRYLMIASMPLILLANYGLGVWKETAILFNLTWIYNDLRGGDDHWIMRNLVIACAFFFYNLGSLKVVLGANAEITQLGYSWTTIVSAVIFTTMQAQDFKDQEGDVLRGRQTAPLVLGDTVARWTFAVAVVVWSFVCAFFWNFRLCHLLCPIVGGLYVAVRIVLKREKGEDRKTWKFWCLWTAMLYLLPAWQCPVELVH